MKRTEIQRRTELRSSKPWPAKMQPMRRTPIAAVSRKRVKDNTQRQRVVSAMREACAGRCARCGRGDMPVHGHERLGRAQGGDILNPDCLLCNDCNGWAEDFPRQAAFTGWKISSKHPQSPDLELGQAWALDGSVVVFTVADAEVSA